MEGPQSSAVESADAVSSSSSSVAIATATTTDAKSGERKKVPLAPGHTLNDWMRVLRSGKDLSGGGSKGAITAEQLRQHKTRETGVWTCINGRVYNITAYLDFHPGGVDEIMKAAGRDGTSLFNKKHPWVNVEGALFFLLSLFFSRCFLLHRSKSGGQLSLPLHM